MNKASMIRKIAFLGGCRGHGSGRDWDDWLEAESQVLWRPAVNLTETDTAYVLKVTVPGFEPADIHVTVRSNDVTVRAESKHDAASTKERVHYLEFTGKRIFRRIDLPGPIDPDQTNATMSKGVLTLSAAKARKPEITPVAIEQPHEKAAVVGGSAS